MQNPPPPMEDNKEKEIDGTTTNIDTTTNKEVDTTNKEISKDNLHNKSNNISIDAFDDDNSLPRATVDKLILSHLKSKSSVAKDARELIRVFCKKFLMIIASSASKKCDLDRKKTISVEHVIHALSEYGLESIIPSVKSTVSNYQEYTKHKPSKQNKFKESGLTLEQLHEEQLRLFQAAKNQAHKEMESIDEIEIEIDGIQEESEVGK